MKRITSVTLFVASVFMLSSTVALAADPTQADFDACNEMAKSSAQSPVSPSASSETTRPTVPPSASAPQAAPSDKTAAEARGAQSPVSPSASPETKPHPTVPPSASGAQAAPSDKTATEARVENQADPLRGIADASKDDARYKQAYRDCMKGRGY